MGKKLEKLEKPVRLSTWKCQGCQYGPCYCSGTNWREESFYGEDDSMEPTCCPIFGEDYDAPIFRFEEIRQEAPSLDFLQRLEDWLGEEGHNKLPEETRDQIYCFRLEARYQYSRGITKVLTGLREFEADRHEFQIAEPDELEKKLRGVKRIEIVATVFAEAFKAGTRVQFSSGSFDVLCPCAIQFPFFHREFGNFLWLGSVLQIPLECGDFFAAFLSVGILRPAWR